MEAFHASVIDDRESYEYLVRSKSSLNSKCLIEIFRVRQPGTALKRIKINQPAIDADVKKEIFENIFIVPGKPTPCQSACCTNTPRIDCFRFVFLGENVKSAMQSHSVLRLVQ